MTPEVLSPSDLSYDAALAALEWLCELGADEAQGDLAMDCYALPDRLAKPDLPAPVPAGAAATAGMLAASQATALPQRQAPPKVDQVGLARQAAGQARTLADLHEALDGFETCDLRKGARCTVRAEGPEAARVMIIGDAPDREEDRAGRPFIGRSGHMLDRMFAAIGLRRDTPDRAAALFLAPVLPWRPPGQREPEASEIAMMRPFLARMVELVDPDVVVLMGNAACSAGLARRGITRLRGEWSEAFGKPAIAMFSPVQLLRSAEAKRDSWADLLALRAKLDSLG
ncbi:uracil-DNA glycosylase [Thioclava litoralis]|uniref:Uracil-DNA glycosylase n=1 Tax=Thioclava litoralis TaxID=3076557 RepID=A0ABZ1DUX6_9RHOB|nr:uracil-DNA glycosylase [Thioclava sp. FTW29]